MERKPDPPPLRTDDVRTVWAGTALWAVALAVSAVAREWQAAGTCAAGLGLGFVGVAYMKRRAAAIARDERASSKDLGAMGS